MVLESVSTKLPDGPEPPGILLNARDVTERAQAYESMRETAESERRFAQEHEIIAEVGRIISSNLNIEDVFELFATEVRRLIKFDMIAASIVDSNQETTTIKYWSGPEEYREDFKTTIPVTGSFTAKVLSSGKPVIVQGPGQHEILQSLVHRSGSDHDEKVNSRLGPANRESRKDNWGATAIFFRTGGVFGTGRGNSGPGLIPDCWCHQWRRSIC